MKKTYLEQEKDYLRKTYDRIMGFKLVSLEIETVEGELYPCLVFENEKGERRIAVVYRDPEGNGPGSVKIIDDIEPNCTEGGHDEYHPNDTYGN
jgi:hypothetical protein